jgi:hypothetical protein
MAILLYTKKFFDDRKQKRLRLLVSRDKGADLCGTTLFATAKKP